MNRNEKYTSKQQNEVSEFGQTPYGEVPNSLSTVSFQPHELGYICVMY